jgi:hypothetical protein
MLDQANALFETVASVLVWSNVLRLRRDKTVAGSNWWVTCYWCFLGVWFCWYYFLVEHYLSMGVQAVIAAGNMTWVGLALRYRKRS